MFLVVGHKLLSYVQQEEEVLVRGGTFHFVLCALQKETIKHHPSSDRPTIRLTPRIFLSSALFLQCPWLPVPSRWVLGAAAPLSDVHPHLPFVAISRLVPPLHLEET